MDAQALVRHEEARELAPRADDRLSNLQRLGKLLAASGYFADAREMAQAAVKVMAGEELGIPPIASMMGVNIIQGKVAIGANLIASRIRAHGYDYRVKRLDQTGCVIEFTRDGKVLGESSFAEEDARAAQLLGKGPWKSFPRNMYFARAISNGARWYAPEIFGGAPVYTPEELGAEVDRDGEVIHKPVAEIDTGGHPVNTREAQEVVRDRKLAELRAQAQEMTTPPAVPSPSSGANGGWAAATPPPAMRVVPKPEPPPEPDVPEDVRKMWALMKTLKDCFAVFAELKKQIISVTGDSQATGYYRTLGEHGMGNAADLKGMGLAKARHVARALWEHLEACKRAVADPMEITDADIPTELGGTWQEGQA